VQARLDVQVVELVSTIVRQTEQGLPRPRRARASSTYERGDACGLLALSAIV